MLRFTKAHAYGNDFLYVRSDAVDGAPLEALARELCDRHAGIGADGLIVFEPKLNGASMRLFNADGSRDASFGSSGAGWRGRQEQRRNQCRKHGARQDRGEHRCLLGK